MNKPLSELLATIVLGCRLSYTIDIGSGSALTYLGLLRDGSYRFGFCLELGCVCFELASLVWLGGLGIRCVGKNWLKINLCILYRCNLETFTARGLVLVSENE